MNLILSRLPKHENCEKVLGWFDERENHT